MVAFYITCFLFVFRVLGAILKLATGVNIWSLLTIGSAASSC